MDNSEKEKVREKEKNIVNEKIFLKTKVVVVADIDLRKSKDGDF